MACPTVNIRTELLYYAQAGGTWTYNGYSETFDGDHDNLAQFSDTPASPPEEFSSLTGDNPTFDPTNHTPGYYSLTYSLSDDGCTAENNIVIPIVETAYAGVDITKSACNGDGSVYRLFDLVSNFGDLPVATTGTWHQTNGTPNPHPGFYNGGANPEVALFDTTTISYPGDTFPLKFTYILPDPVVEGFTQARCYTCTGDQANVNVTYYTVIGSCCPDSETCYQAVIPDGSVSYLILRNVGSITNSNLPMDFPYSFPAENDDFIEHLNDFLINNGGGHATIQALGGNNTVSIYGACVGFDRVCLNEGCSSFILFTEIDCD